MNLPSFISKGLLLLLLLSFPIWSLAQQSEEQAAAASADHFLRLIDSGQYQESWRQTAAIFKSQVAQQQWTEQLQSLRPLLGGAERRTIRSAQRATSLPGAPDGDYVVLQFDTFFEKKKDAIETVTLSHNGEKWLVAGYFIR